MTLLISITHHTFCLLMADNQQNHSLTNHVLVASMGKDELAAELLEQLRSHVKPPHDLKRCGEILEKIMDPRRGELLTRDKGVFEIVMRDFIPMVGQEKLPCAQVIHTSMNWFIH